MESTVSRATTLKALCLLAVPLLPAGCTSLGDYTSDAFDPGRASQTAFLADAAQCEAAAEGDRSWTAPRHHRLGCRAARVVQPCYAACMAREGYALRGPSADAPFPYAVDPWPG